MTTAATKSQATRTRKNAKATARSAASTVRNARATATKQSRAVTDDVSTQGKRVVGAYKAEVKAVAKQPTRPLYFALGVADRTVGAVKEIPSALTPSRTRQRVVATVKKAGDLAERAQRGYTEVAKDGEGLVASVRGQESTKEAVKLADRAGTRAKQAVKDVEKSAEAAVEAVQDAVTKIG